MDVTIQQHESAKDLILTNVNGKTVTIEAGLVDLGRGPEPAVVITGIRDYSVSGVLATVRSGSKTLDSLIAGLYELRAHYRKLGGR